VEITVPEYGKVTVDVPVAGAFYVIEEKSKKVTSLTLGK
jgi:proline racemase